MPGGFSRLLPAGRVSRVIRRPKAYSIGKLPIRGIIIHLGIYGGALAILAKLLPWHLYVPLAGLLAAVHVLIVHYGKRGRYEAILDSVRNVQSEAFDGLESIGGKDIDDMIFEAFKEIASELERRCFQLVEKNIQMLSMKEIGMMIISSLDVGRIVDAVTTFLSRGLGFKELFIGIFNEERQDLSLNTFRERAGQQARTEDSVSFAEMDGLVKKTILARQPVLIRDADMHPIGKVNGKSLFEESTMQSFIVVPLVKSSASQVCWRADDCILLRENQLDESKGLLDDLKCPACHHFPVLGVIAVTDGFRASVLSRVDLVSVETLALQISTILENTRLYTELKKEESFRENVINSMLNGLITVDKSGTIVLANEAAEKLSGYSAEQLRGMPVNELIIDKLRERGRSPVVRALETGRKNFQREAWLIKRDSSKLPVVFNTSFLLDESKEVQGVLAVFYDTTRIKRMEEEIMHLDKLAALGRFSSSIAHEIRNPLTGIATGIQYLMRFGNISEEQQGNIDFILNEVGRIDRLIGDIMNVVRVSDLIYQDTKIETIIKSSIATLSDLAARRSVRIKTEYPEESRRVMVDGDRITQVMINLIKNAIEASNKGQKVIIRVSYSHGVDDVLFDDVRDYVIIDIEDRGVGIREDEKSKIFEPFFSTKHEGTGLGLYVSYSIIERHGGAIFVDSESGLGSTFTVYLPVEKVQHGDSRKISNPPS